MIKPFINESILFTSYKGYTKSTIVTGFDKTWLRRTELHSFLVDYAEEMKITASSYLSIP